MELRITGQSAEALVSSIELYLYGLDLADEEQRKERLRVLLAIQFYMIDLLRQAGVDESEPTEMELTARSNNRYYVALTED
jgi:hypothetical protein